MSSVTTICGVFWQINPKPVENRPGRQTLHTTFRGGERPVKVTLAGGVGSGAPPRGERVLRRRTGPAPGGIAWWVQGHSFGAGGSRGLQAEKALAALRNPGALAGGGEGLECGPRLPNSRVLAVQESSSRLQACSRSTSPSKAGRQMGKRFRDAVKEGTCPLSVAEGNSQEFIRKNKNIFSCPVLHFIALGSGWEKASTTLLERGMDTGMPAASASVRPASRSLYAGLQSPLPPRGRGRGSRRPSGCARRRSGMGCPWWGSRRCCR